MCMFYMYFQAACQGGRTDGTWRAASGPLRHHGDGRAAEAALFSQRQRHMRRAPARSRGRATPGQTAQTGMGQSPFCVGVAKSRIQVEVCFYFTSIFQGHSENGKTHRGAKGQYQCSRRCIGAAEWAGAPCAGFCAPGGFGSGDTDIVSEVTRCGLLQQ